MKKIISIFACVAVLGVFVYLVIDAYLMPETGPEAAGSPAASVPKDKQPEDGVDTVYFDPDTFPAAEPVRPIGSSDHILGGQGDIDFIVYLDAGDELSRGYYPTLRSLADTYGNDIKVAIRPYFVPGDPLSRAKSGWVECASQIGETEAFFRAYDYFLTEEKIFANNNEGKTEFSDFTGIDPLKFQICLDDPKLPQILQDRLTEADRCGVIGSPTSFIGSKSLPGAYPLHDFTDSSGRNRLGLNTIIAEYKNPVLQ